MFHSVIHNRLLQATICLLLFFGANGQKDSSIRLIKTITGDIADFTTDNLGNLFLVGERQQIKKLNDHFDSVGLFNDVRRYGKLYSIDASNPLKILLYYREFSTIIVLDRFLNLRNTIDLRLSNIFQTRAISQSYDNNIWVFDDLDYKIKKIDESGKQLLETTDFRVLFDAPPRPDKIEDFNKYLFAYDSTKGLFIFDYYGTLQNQVAFKNLKDVQGFSKGIIARDSTGLVYYEPSTIETKHQLLPAAILTAIKIKIVGNKLFSMPYRGIVEVYQLP
ncbi:MAG: hypothetical protein ABIX01_06555 [Chitinophagaceae bacterium]